MFMRRGTWTDTWNMAPERQVIVEMARHGGAIVGNQHATVSLDPDQDLRIKRAPGRYVVVVNRLHAQIRRHLRQLRLDEWRDVLVE